jgi:hypothetical protein
MCLENATVGIKKKWRCLKKTALRQIPLAFFQKLAQISSF